LTPHDYMMLALDLGRQQKGRTAENPAVGCVLVKERVHWRGAALMQEAGIDVKVGLCEADAQKAHKDFFARLSQ